MRSMAMLLACLLSAAAFGALPGVTALKMPPEKLTDAELTTLLGARIKSADVVAIGETLHGSAGLLRVQTRLIRYLVENHGLRLIVWETAVLRSIEMSGWVEKCAKTKSPPPIDVLYMPTTADLPLWEWVCDFNRAHPGDPIVFRGMDVWDRPWEHYARIRAAAARGDLDAARVKNVDAFCPAARSSSWEDIEAVFGILGQDGVFLPRAAYDACRATLTAVLDASRRAANEASARKSAIADAAFEVALSASTLLGWLGFYNYQWSHDILGWNERDRAQGRNLMLLMEKHRAKRAILSAHTSHVSHNRSAADWWGYGDLKSGVYFFTAMTRKNVFNIALTAYSASGTQGEWSLPVAKNSIDKRLHDAKLEFAFFTSGAPFLADSARWWMQNGNFPGRYESGVEIVPKDHFDAYFFLAESFLDKALPQRSMWQP